MEMVEGQDMNPPSSSLQKLEANSSNAERDNPSSCNIKHIQSDFNKSLDELVREDASLKNIKN